MKDWDLIYKAKGIFQTKPSRRVLAAITSFQKNGFTRVLDLGCGTGRHTAYLRDAGFHVYACDHSAEALETVRGLMPEVHFDRCGMTSLPYPDRFFDALICHHVLQHGRMADVQSGVREMYRVLRPGGELQVIVVSTEHPKYFTGREIETNTRIKTDALDGDIPHHFFTREELAGLFDQFRILKLAHFKGPSELDETRDSAAWELRARREQ